MSYPYLLFLCLFFTIISGAITGFIRQITIKYHIYDIPNNRSSHDIPKPKGGGLSVVLLLLGTTVFLLFNQMIDFDISISLILGTIIVAVTGFIDDYKNLSILARAIAYTIGAVISIYFIGGLNHLSINDYNVHLSYFGYFLAVLFLVWLTNLYNFMDGTDGFASIQAICVSLFCGVVLYLSNNVSFAIILFCLASATTGFLYWNWAPAKIFMGDVGSCTLGFIFGLLSIYTEKKGIISISVWLILLAPFIGDTTFTLIKRIFNREKWYEAHNSHAYQKLYRQEMSHKKLAINLLIINVFCIWPIAYIAFLYSNLEFSMLVLTYFIIGMLWQMVQLKFKKIA